MTRAKFIPLWRKLLEIPETDECVEWAHTRVAGPRPYGQVWYENALWYVHRLSFILNKGPIADDLQACHSCDNPPCYNPRHLFSGTRLENMTDCKNKGRNFIGQGESAGRAILSEAQVLEIRAIHRPRTRGVGHRCLARKYGVSDSTMRAIITGRSWRHLL